MLTAVILAREGEEEALTRTLASLMPGVLDGLVREAAVVDGSGATGVALVADHAGCEVYPSLSAAIASAKGDWLLFLEAGARLQDGWTEAVRGHVLASGESARFRADGELLAAFRPRRPFRRGLLVRQEKALVGTQEGFGKPRSRRLSARVQPAR